MKAVHGEVMRSSTTMPAEVIKKKEYYWNVKGRPCGDVAIFKLEEGKFPSYLMLLAKEESNGKD